jgi:N4-(beta-N-acetylglucosaminyl)-L-asparaginase
LQDAKGRPNFNVRFFAVRKNGEFAGASLYAGVKMAVHDGESARLVDCSSLYDDVLDESL